jgi:hypothetical protein
MGRMAFIKAAIRGREGVERVAVVNGDLSAGISAAATAAANPSAPIMLMKVSDGGAITRHSAVCGRLNRINLGARLRLFSGANGL